MNLVDILEQRIGSLPIGDYSRGLRAVLQHVRVAAGHLHRGEKQSDDTAFTDAIYRTNQAFEGSLKEAYRVLAEKDPERVRPFDIESFFEDKKLLRSRVLTQFTRYRTEWRNPSAHDYSLDFDEDEALLAIVSVCAFAIVLVDQMAEKLSFDVARAAAESNQREIDPSLSLVDQVADALLRFHVGVKSRTPQVQPREVEIIGSLSGHLTSQLPDARIETEVVLPSEERHRIDLVAMTENTRVFVEVQRSSGRGTVQIRNGLTKLERYMTLANVTSGVLFVHSVDPSAKMGRTEQRLREGNSRIVVVAPV